MQGVPKMDIEDLQAIYGLNNPQEQIRAVFPNPTKKLFEEAFQTEDDANDYKRLLIVRHPWSR